MRHKAIQSIVGFLLLCGVALLVRFGMDTGDQGNAQAQASKNTLSANDSLIDEHAERMIDEGRRTFRFDTFGDEAFWGDLLGLHKAIEGTGFVGGVATPDLKLNGVSPSTALAVGLKVDVDALPDALKQQLAAGQ